LKYLFINQSSFEKGGISTLVLHFLKYESNCIFLNLNSDSTYSSRNREFFLSWEESHHPETVSNIILLIFKIYPEEPFIIIPNYGHIAHVASALALLQNDKCRMLGICHNNQDATFELLKSFSPVFSHYLAVSKWVKNKLLHTLNKKNVSHIYPITIKSSVSSSINHTRPLRLIYVSRLTNVDKNALRLIPMIKGFIKSNFDFTLDIFGDGPCYFELESFINDLKLGTSKIILHGDASHSTVQKSFKDSDILISLSSREGFGMAIAEAMGAKVVPLIMRFDGGICELLQIEDFLSQTM
jgi:glycosyltransferase involved in cell wall biosynthesis